jgi:hypothetical protein
MCGWGREGLGRPQAEAPPQGVAHYVRVGAGGDGVGLGALGHGLGQLQAEALPEPEL